MLLFALFAGNVFAARDAKPEANEFPNATREEPEVDISERSQRELNKAVDAINEDQSEKAIASLDKVLADKRASPYAQALAHQLKGQLAWQNDNDEEAIRELRKAVDLDALPNSRHFTSIYQIAQLQVNNEQYADALASLTEWRRLSGSETAEALALEANVDYRLEKYPEAVTAMKKAISMTDKPSTTWTQILMASYLEQDKYDEAAAMIQQQLAKNPTDKKLLNQLGNIYLQAGQDQKALDLMAKAKNDGLVTTSDDYLQLAKLYAAGDKPKEAAATLKEGLDKGIVTANYDSLKLLGDVCTQSEDDACAMDAYTRASPMATDGNVDYQLGYILFYAGKSAEASAALDRAFAKGGLRQPGEAHILKGDAENDLGNAAAAMAEWKKALASPTTKSMAEQRIKLASGGVKIKRGKK
jgi:Tfp pilus assembly protein PilF